MTVYSVLMIFGVASIDVAVMGLTAMLLFACISEVGFPSFSSEPPDDSKIGHSSKSNPHHLWFFSHASKSKPKKASKKN